MKILQFLDKPSKWTKGALARDHKDIPVAADSPEACCWCLSGLISYCYSGLDASTIYNKVCDTIQLKFPDRADSEYPLSRFNNNPETTYEDIRAVLLEAGVQYEAAWIRY